MQIPTRPPKQRGTKKVLRCFGKARKEEADCKASRPDEPKAKPYPSNEGINMKSLLAFDDYNLFEKIIALNFPFYDKNCPKHWKNQNGKTPTIGK